ncbi:hypothetical protein M9Y10_043783 [Tritrichomonas musculus]|uniref:Dynein axonemal assembly factor 5 TPR repeats domain-containing protein n=1 Tax=Tritrichomonas musculus TaxID=1915356 RepID=A0ABR2K0N7_9EUKA
MKQVPLHEVERLIKQLDGKTRSEKTRASQKLTNIPVFPNLISQPDQFLSEVVAPVLRHFSNDTEMVRQNCVITAQNYAKELGKDNLKDILYIMLPPIFERLKEEKIEPAEQIRMMLMQLLLDLIKMVSEDTNPNNWNNYADNLINPLTLAFNSRDPEIKKVGCDVLDAAIPRCSQENLSNLSLTLTKALLPNCTHSQFEVRKKSLNSIASLAIASGVLDGVDNLIKVLQNLVDDRNSGVRKAAINLCKDILIKHAERENLFFPLMMPLMAFSSPIVHVFPLEVNSKCNQPNITAEATLAFNSLNEIGLSIQGEFEETERVFNDKYTLNAGAVHIVTSRITKFMKTLLPMLTDWTDKSRKYGYSVTRTFLYIVGNKIESNIIFMLPVLGNSLRDIRDDNENALQCASIMASFVPGKVISDYLAPRITNEGPKEIILLITASAVNGSFESEQLDQILKQCMHVRVYESLECVEPLVNFVLAIIHRSTDFANQNSVALLIFILKLCEKTDAIKCFTDAFGRPIDTVFAENMSELLKSEDKTPQFLTHLMLTAPPEAIKANQELACTELSAATKNNEQDPAAKSAIEILITKLADRGAFENVSMDFVQVVLDDMIWCAGKVKIPYRENATYALGSLIKSNAINDEMLNNQIEKILPMILSSLDDSWADCVRVAGSSCMFEFVKRSKNDEKEFEKIYPAMKERLDDHVLQVRVMAAKILAIYLPKCAESSAADSIPEKWNELFIFIDDDSEEIRNAAADLVRSVAKVPKWKESIINNLKEQNSYHHESNELCQKLVSELQ